MVLILTTCYLRKAVQSFLKKITEELPDDPATPLLGIYSKKEKTLDTHTHTKSIPMFVVAALLIIAKIWKQPKQPSIGEWIKKLWYTYTVDYSSAIKK